MDMTSGFFRRAARVLAVTFASVATVGVSLTAWAAPSAQYKGEVEYSVPVPRADLKPFSTFFVSRFEVFQDEDSAQFRLQLTLPRDLVGGQTVEVELVETGRQGSKISFTKDIGDAVCDVPRDWDTAKCTYKFNENLRDQVGIPEARAYLAKKYKGDRNLAKRDEVAVGIFLSTDSVGVADLRGFGSACSACTLGNGTWTSEYTNGTNVIEAELEFSRRTGHYFNNSGFGDLKNISYAGNVATGTWTYGGSQGWFRFVFDPESETFAGNWGSGAVGSPAKGTWTGSRLQD